MKTVGYSSTGGSKKEQSILTWSSMELLFPKNRGAYGNNRDAAPSVFWRALSHTHRLRRTVPTDS